MNALTRPYDNDTTTPAPSQHLGTGESVSNLSNAGVSDLT